MNPGFDKQDLHFATLQHHRSIFDRSRALEFIESAALSEVMVSDQLGARLKVGILVPAFNSTVQPEMEAMRPPGVTNHVARIEMPERELTTDADQAAVVESFGPDLFGAVRRVMHVRPKVLILGWACPA